MGNFLETFTIAFLIIIGASCLIGIGWILTGKQKVKPGACGRNPATERDASCGKKISCEICKASNKEENDDE